MTETLIGHAISATVSLIGIAIGAAVTWYFADHYYRKAAEELERKSAELKRLNTLLLLGMEHQEWIKINYNPKREIVGFEKRIKAQGNDFAELGVPDFNHG